MDQTPKPLDTTRMAWSEYRESDEIRWRYKFFPDRERCHVGFGMMELPPGCHTGTAHYHLKEEEQIYVLEGEMEVRLGAHWHALGPGGHVWFPAGEATEHKLRNLGEASCRFILMGERKRDEVVVYPDIDRVHVRVLGQTFGTPVEPSSSS